MSFIRRSTLGLALCAWLAGGAFASADQRVIVKTKQPYDDVKQRIAELGGIVTIEFKHANALVAVVPDDKLEALQRVLGVDYVVRDEVIPDPHPRQSVTLASENPVVVSSDQGPADFSTYGLELTNVRPLQTAGFLGQGVIVAVIDSGVSLTATALCANPSSPTACANSSRVIGGESFVPGATEPGANSSLNGPHGTFVATTIGANVSFIFSRTGLFATAVRRYCNAVSTCSTQLNATQDLIPMVGQAPGARFFALKVFPAAGGGAPTSRILAAMDRAIELKQTMLPAMRVVNMSLGGATLNAGGDVEDELASSMAAAGISLIASAGNEGPSGITVSSPGTARNILTVGAASSAVQERILADLQFGSGLGALFRPDSTQQIASFSSRGPDADGRIDPEVIANGVANFVQGADGSLSLVSGTSFSAPTVSGIVAALYSVKPSATPEEIRSAIVGSARAGTVPTATSVDQGAGYVDAAGAATLLNAGAPFVGDPAPARDKVEQNIKKGAGIETINSSNFKTTVKTLRPAERREFFFNVSKNTVRVKLTISNITPELPPGEQNQLFGDDLQVAVHSAMTSGADYLDLSPADPNSPFVFLNSDATFTFDNPQTGLLRVTLLGDWTNAGRISADVRIEEVKAPLPARIFKGDIGEGELTNVTFDIPPGTASATFRLSWENDWSAYPTNDLDMILVSPTLVGNFDGATFRSPELVTITNPTAGTWTIFVQGFTISTGREKFQVRVDLK